MDSEEPNNESAENTDTANNNNNPSPEENPDTSNNSSGGSNADEDPLSFVNVVSRIYNNRYYWEIAKSVVIFGLALKVAHECKHIAIPMRDYEPFAYINVCTCR